MNEENEQQPDKLRPFLENIEKKTRGNFPRIKNRLFNFYGKELEKKLNVSGAELREEFDRDDPDLKIEDLRLAKALQPTSIRKPGDIPPVPESIRQEILEDIRPNFIKSQRYYANNVILGLTQLFQDKGIVGSGHPDSLVHNYGGRIRQNYENVVAELGNNNAYPTYAVVEKQENDAGYIQSVGRYGYGPGQEEMGILIVLQMKSSLLDHSVFTFGDSTYFLSKREYDGKIEEAKNRPQWKDLEKMFNKGNVDINTKDLLETELSKLVFPTGEYMIKDTAFSRMYGGRIVPTEQTISENILSVSDLLPAFGLSRKLKNWGGTWQKK